MKTAKFALALVLGTWFLGSASPAQTPSFPERPIKMIVGFSAGGGTDVVARILAQKMSDTIGQSVVVENRTGASGLIAAEAVAKSPPDGYTIMMGSQTTLAVAPTLYRSTGLDLRHVISPASLSPAFRPWSLWCIPRLRRIRSPT
jgi:tripartite-type tricarboxylate transporter receptor subunit TctC